MVILDVSFSGGIGGGRKSELTFGSWYLAISIFL